MFCPTGTRFVFVWRLAHVLLSMFLVEKVACTEWIKVFRWIDGHEDWAEPRHQKHGLDVLEELDVQRGNQILNRLVGFFRCLSVSLTLEGGLAVSTWIHRPRWLYLDGQVTTVVSNRIVLFFCNGSPRSSFLLASWLEVSRTGVAANPLSPRLYCRLSSFFHYDTWHLTCPPGLPLFQTMYFLHFRCFVSSPPSLRASFPLVCAFVRFYFFSHLSSLLSPLSSLLSPLTSVRCFLLARTG